MTSFFTSSQTTASTRPTESTSDLFSGFEQISSTHLLTNLPDLGDLSGYLQSLIANGNQGSSSGAIVPQQETHKALTAVHAIKTALEKTKALETPDLQEQFQYLEDLVQHFFDAGSHGNSNGVSLTQLKAIRQAVWHLSQHMRQVSDIEAIARVALEQLLGALKVDRALVYRFDSPTQGRVLVEVMTGGWTPAQGKELMASWLGFNSLADYTSQGGSIIHDIYQHRLTPFQTQLLEQYQVKASLACPIWVGKTVWGLLVIQQCNAARPWNEAEVSLVEQTANQFSLLLQPAYWQAEVQKQTDGERLISRMVERIYNALDLQTLFNTTVKEVRRFLQADRVGVFQFYPNSGYDDGEFVSEDVQPGFTSAIANRIHDHCFGNQYADKYKEGRIQAVHDIYDCRLSDCHIDVLSKYEVRANLIVPLLKNQELWGLLCIHQCSGPRHWQDGELDFVKRIASQFTLALQQLNYVEQIRTQAQQLEKVVELDRALTKIINRIRQASDLSLDLQTLFNTTVKEVRRFLQADRVGVFQFYPNSGYDDGEFVSEDVQPGFTSAIANRIHDHCFGNQYADKYKEGRIQAVHDIYDCGLSDCHIDVLSKYEVRANLIVPLLKNQELWGLLCIHQCSGPRHWQDGEIDFVQKVAAQFTLAIQQVEYVSRLAKIAEREQILTRLTNKIRQTTVLETVFNSTTQDMRRLMNVERVAVYQFRPDYFGDIIAESKTGDYPSLVGAAWEDPYLQEHQGGRFRNNETLVAEDIYTAGMTDCHVEALEAFGFRACAVVPIFQGQKLWGLLSAFQHSGPRRWEDGEVKLLSQVATQIGLALQQNEYLEQLKQQAEEGAQAIAREKEGKERIQKNVLQLLMAVRPALEGDLTVRAPVTEDEVGTVADAYNNTIQSLRQIVSQVQTAAIKVGQTSQEKGSAIGDLSQQVQQELQEVTQALQRIEEMVNTSNTVAVNAQQVEVAVQQANDIVRAGDVAMNRTVDGILGIRETVSETSKKIKRLSESSQKISRVVSLISNFTTQTQLLALNAAIEATRAGEYGRGFAVVADEVRSLARQSADATTDIEKLVQEIQTETTAVAAAMDTGIDQVVNGTALVNETRQSLNEIVMATDQISQLVQGITQATQSQAQQAQTVTQAMNTVLTIADQTATDTRAVAASFQELLETAQELQASVGQFKVSVQ